MPRRGCTVLCQAHRALRPRRDARRRNRSVSSALVRSGRRPWTHHVGNQEEQGADVAVGSVVAYSGELGKPELDAANGDAEHGDERTAEVAERIPRRIGEECDPHDRVCRDECPECSELVSLEWAEARM